MNENIYTPILGVSTRTTFLNYIDSLDIPQIDYFAVGVQDCNTKQSISLMSSLEWQNYYSENQLADYDPLRRATLNTKRNLIPFDEIDYIDNFGKEIMRQRSLVGIRNGIVLMERFPRYNFMITLATGFAGFDAFSFLRRYYEQIQWMKNDFIQMIEKEALNFITK